MSAKEIDEWAVYLRRVEPQGPVRQDFMLARVCLLIAEQTERLLSVWASKYRPHEYTFGDFMPDYDELLARKPDEEEPDEIREQELLVANIATVASLNKLFGGIDLREESKES